MIARIQKTMKKRAEGDKGFTLIELLVVIIIIGILAAIAIPAFLNQREKAWVSQAQSDLKNGAIAAESFAVDHNGAYSGLDSAGLTANGFHSTANVTTAVGTVTAGTYVLTARNTNLADDKDTYTYTSATGIITGPTAG